MITIYHKDGKEKDIKIIKEPEKDSWVHVESPTDTELKKKKKKLQLDESVLADAIDRHEIPRIEIENDVVYLFTRFAYMKESQIKTAPILIILATNHIISISIEPFPRLEPILQLKPTTAHRLKLHIKLLSEVQETYSLALNVISKNVRIYTYELEKIKNKDIVQFVLFENDLHDFNLALVKTNKDISSLLSRKIVPLSNPEHDKLEDVYLSNSQLIDICNENIRTIVNLRESYSTIITNNLNRVIKLFTSLTVILTIPTVISSFFGMNVVLPNTTFMQIVFGTSLISTFALVIFIYKDWL